MNIQNAFASYGINNTNTSNNNVPSGSGLEEALARIGSDKSGKTSKASFMDSLHASFETAKITQDSATTSDLYSKNFGIDDNSSISNFDEKSDAEKNQEHLDNVSNRMSTDDMETLVNEGFDVAGMTAEALDAALERIKLQKEVFNDAVQAQVQDIRDDREAVIAQAIAALPGDANAARIADKLLKANLPVTEANLRKVAEAVNMTAGRTSVSAAEAEYLIRNKLAPTIENIYEAKSAALSGSQKEKTLTDAAWAQLEPTVNHMLFQAGLRSGKQMMDAAKAFIRKDIPLTSENLLSFSKITSIKLSLEDVLTRSVDAISVGHDPKNANLLNATDRQVRQLIKNNSQVTNEGIDLAVAKKAAQTGNYDPEKIELSLSDLHEAQADADRHDPASYELLDRYNSIAPGDAASIKARRQLEEVKAKMTFEAGYRLAKEGIRIDTVSMNRLITDLKVLENRFYSGFFTEAGMKPGTYSESDVDLLKDTTQKLAEIEKMPATLIFDTVDRADKMSISSLYQEGTGDAAKRAFSRYSQTLETVQTAPDAKYGDSIEKAFQNVDSLLKEAGIAATPEARRATRILGYASAEINAENITKVEEYDKKLQDVFTNLHPAVTVRLIRDGINPLTSTLDELNKKITEIKDKEGITTDDNFSNFLVNLDKKGDLSASERDAYIAIYRALHQIQQSEEPAVGQVFRSGQEPTLHGLLTAVRSGKFTGTETLINDTFQAVSKLSTDVDKIENKIRAGLSKPSAVLPETVNKQAEAADNVIRELSEDRRYTAEEWITNIRDLAATGENATRFLEDFNILTTMENITAAKEMLGGNNEIYHNWKKYKTLATGEAGVLPDFIGSMNSEEEMEAAFKSFADETKNIKSILQRDPSMTKLDVKALKKMDVGVRFINRLGKRQFYSIPVDTGEDIVSMNVTILNNEAESSSKVMVSVPTSSMGLIRAEASIEDDQMKCFISGDSREGMERLSERQLNLFADLAANGISIGRIFYGTEEVPSDRYAYKTGGLYADKPEGEPTNPSNELYRIAKVFVTHVMQTDRS